MLVIALNNFIELTDNAEKKAHWTAACDTLKRNIRQHLWDAERHKFIPHIYLKDSPFPAKFDENQIYYHGGTAVAIQAGLLSEEEIREANQRMLENVKRAHAQTIGLTLYPTYPAGSFKGVGMYLLRNSYAPNSVKRSHPSNPGLELHRVWFRGSPSLV